MPRPKKKPRDRFQITLPRPTGKRLREVAKKLDRDISEVVDAALRLVLGSLRDDSTHDELKLDVQFPAEVKKP